MRKLQWDRRRCFQLMKDHGDQVRLPFHCFLQRMHSTGVKNEFLEQIGDIDYTTISW